MNIENQPVKTPTEPAKKPTIAVIDSLHPGADANYIAYHNLVLNSSMHHSLILCDERIERPNYTAIMAGVQQNRFTYGIVPAPPEPEVVQFWLQKIGQYCDVHVIAEESFPYINGEPPRTFHLVSKLPAGTVGTTCIMTIVIILSAKSKGPENLKEKLELFQATEISMTPANTGVHGESAWYVRYRITNHPATLSIIRGCLGAISSRYHVLGCFNDSPGS